MKANRAEEKTWGGPHFVVVVGGGVCGCHACERGRVRVRVCVRERAAWARGGGRRGRRLVYGERWMRSGDFGCETVAG